MKVLRDLGLNINEDIFISGLTSSSGLIEKDQCFIALQGLMVLNLISSDSPADPLEVKQEVLALLSQ